MSQVRWFGDGSTQKCEFRSVALRQANRRERAGDGGVRGLLQQKKKEGGRGESSGDAVAARVGYGFYVLFTSPGTASKGRFF